MLIGFRMNITYGKEADAMYIKLREGEFAKNKQLDDHTILDLDKDGNVLDIELSWVSEWMSLKSLSHLRIKQLV